jgi:hypothetical protein
VERRENKQMVGRCSVGERDQLGKNRDDCMLQALEMQQRYYNDFTHVASKQMA